MVKSFKKKTKRHSKKHGGGKKTRKQQKLWKMKGCSTSTSKNLFSLGKKCSSCGKNHMKSFYGGSGCGNTSCPIAPFPMQGGFNPVPAPLVGDPWKPTVHDWPGVDGIDNNRNYLENNMYYNDPQTMMKLNGGGKKHKKTRKGGGLIPQDLVNLGRDITYNFSSAYNALNGNPAPVNPLPYKQQLTH